MQDVDALASRIADAFEVNIEEARVDIRSLMDDWCAKGLVRVLR
ncbi:MAG: PqqD family peptide modification chaperone [Propylenella sp.]